MGTIILKTSLIWLILLISLEDLSAQTINFQAIPDDKTQFGFSIDRPFYFNINSFIVSEVYQFFFNIPVSSDLNMIGSVPYVSANDYIYNDYTYDESGFGNIFIGVQTNPGTMDNSKSIFSVGLFFPTGRQETYPAAYVNYYDIRKYFPSFGLYFNYAYIKVNSEGFNYGLEVGTDILIPIPEAALLFHYGINAGYQVSRLLFNIDIFGNAVINGEFDNLGDRFTNLIDFGAQLKESTITPQIFYRIYLGEEMRNVTNGVLGIGVIVSIN